MGEERHWASWNDYSPSSLINTSSPFTKGLLLQKYQTNTRSTSQPVLKPREPKRTLQFVRKLQHTKVRLQVGQVPNPEYVEGKQNAEGPGAGAKEASGAGATPQTLSTTSPRSKEKGISGNTQFPPLKVRLRYDVQTLGYKCLRGVCSAKPAGQCHGGFAVGGGPFSQN